MSQVSTSEKIDELIRLAESGDTRGLVDLAVQLHAERNMPGWEMVSIVAFNGGVDEVGSLVVRRKR